LIEVYFQEISVVISKTAGVQSSCLTYDKRSSYIGFIRGSICFYDGSVLHLREFVNVQYGIERYMYAYHYQKPDGIMIFRYDNTPHFPNLATFPHHKHEGHRMYKLNFADHRERFDQSDDNILYEMKLYKRHWIKG
jgi:hypothetical protein